MQYQERFGDESPLDSIIHHVRAMARDTAMLRVLGPNPEASARFTERLIASEVGQTALEGTGKKAARAAGNLFGKAGQFRRMFDLVSGRLDSPGNSTFAAIDESNRNVLQAANPPDPRSRDPRWLETRDDLIRSYEAHAVAMAILAREARLKK